MYLLSVVLAAAGSIYWFFVGLKEYWQPCCIVTSAVPVWLRKINKRWEGGVWHQAKIWEIHDFSTKAEERNQYEASAFKHLLSGIWLIFSKITDNYNHDDYWLLTMCHRLLMMTVKFMSCENQFSFADPTMLLLDWWDKKSSDIILV